MSEEELLTVTEAAARAKCSPETIRTWIRAARLPSRKTPGGHFRIRASDLYGVLQDDPYSPQKESTRKAVV